jgi:glycolate oxidase
MLDRRVRRRLENQVGPGHLRTAAADLAAYAYDAYGAAGERRLPDAVAFPADTDEVSRIVQVCAEHDVPIVPRGAGTGYVAGAVATRGGVVLNLTRMRHGLSLDREAARIRADAGVITADLHHLAAAAGLYYPPDPGSATTSTIGGNVATNAAGSHALRYGTTADYIVGATAVTADGRVRRLGEGGAASDLLPLLPGSEGTLAVVTDVVLRLLPAPAARVTLSAAFDDLAKACACVAALSDAGIVPAALELLDSAALRAVAETGTVTVPAAEALVLVELEGDEAVVAAERETVRTTLEKAGASIVDSASGADAHRLWAVRKAVSAAVATLMIGKVNEDVVVPRDRINELVAEAPLIGDRHEVPVVTFGHLGDGNLHVTFLIDPRRPGDRRRGDAAAADLFDLVLRLGGSLTGEHGVGTAKLGWVERQLGAAGVEMMRRIKEHYDPRGILNPGIKVPGRVEALEPAAV